MKPVLRSDPSQERSVQEHSWFLMHTEDFVAFILRKQTGDQLRLSVRDALSLLFLLWIKHHCKHEQLLLYEVLSEIFYAYRSIVTMQWPLVTVSPAEQPGH